MLQSICLSCSKLTTLPFYKYSLKFHKSVQLCISQIWKVKLKTVPLIYTHLNRLLIDPIQIPGALMMDDIKLFTVNVFKHSNDQDQDQTLNDPKCIEKFINMRSAKILDVSSADKTWLLLICNYKLTPVLFMFIFTGPYDRNGACKVSRKHGQIQICCQLW